MLDPSASEQLFKIMIVAKREKLFMKMNIVNSSNCLWLLGGFLDFVWTEKLMKGRFVKLEILIGVLKMKYRAYLFSKKQPSLNHIFGISS